MASVAISQLPVTTSTSGTDVFPLVQGGITKRITTPNLFASATGVPLVAGTTGTLTVARGGTGTTTSTGSGAVVLATSPTLTTPVLGVATATSINKVTLTAPATGATLTLADNKALLVNNTLTLSGTDYTTMTFPTTSATLARTDAAQTFTGTQTFAGPIVESVQTLSGPGAINITQTVTKFTSTAAGNALTLADGVSGQIKTIVYVAETAGADTGVLTPTNLGAGTTITFTSVGNACVLQFLNSDWWVIANYGCTVA